MGFAATNILVLSVPTLLREKMSDRLTELSESYLKMKTNLEHVIEW